MAGVWHRGRRVVIIAVSCRRVVAPVAPVPNCPSQDSTCARLQCSCKSQSLEQPAGERDWRVEEVLQEGPCFCGNRGHPLPQGAPIVVGRGDGRLAGTCHPAHVGTAGLLPVYTSVFAVISARTYPPLPGCQVWRERGREGGRERERERGRGREGGREGGRE